MEAISATDARELIREPPRQPSPVADPRQDIIRKCQGQTIRVPNLLKCMPEWPSIFNPHMAEVSLQIDEWLKTVPVAQEIVTKHRQKGNYITICALHYPDCPKERLLTLTQLHYWIFMWDDDIDTGGELSIDSNGTSACCAATKACIDACLGPSSPPTSSPPSSRGTIAMLYQILRDFRAGLGPGSRERFRLDMRNYVDAVAGQQKERLGVGLPDPWTLFEVRAIDIGVIPFITLQEFAMDFEVPEWVRGHEAFQTIIMESSKLVVLQNEIMSLPKEFRVLQIENMCLLFVQKYDMSIQEAVTTVVGLVTEHYDISRATAARLPWSETDDQLNEALRQYVLICQRLMTGTTHWSYICERYVKPSQVNADFETVLELCVM